MTPCFPKKPFRGPNIPNEAKGRTLPRAKTLLRRNKLLDPQDELESPSSHLKPPLLPPSTLTRNCYSSVFYPPFPLRLSVVLGVAQ